MAQIAFLNELSHPTGSIQRWDAISVLNNLSDMMLSLRKLLPKVTVVATEPLLNLQVGDRYSITELLNDIDRDRKRFMLSLANLAPFRTARTRFADPDPGVTVYRFNGDPFDGVITEGIGLADIYSGVAISFYFDERWQIRVVPVRVEQYLENEDHKIWTTEVNHCVCKDDVEFHRSWLLTLPRKDIRDTATLWRGRNDILPYLVFLPQVEGDLRGLGADAFARVMSWLGRLNDAIANWNSAGSATPVYPPHTTGEGEIRREYFWWFYEGVARCFHMHGRYTPGDGRIHFWLSTSERKAIIGYIGRKLFGKLDR